jgi:hypothetical protein
MSTSSRGLKSVWRVVWVTAAVVALLVAGVVVYPLVRQLP